MGFIESYLGQKIEIELSGNIQHTGYLIDSGTDIIVLQTKESYLYIPFIHIQNIKKAIKETTEYEIRFQSPIDHQNEKISYRKVLNNAKGLFIEILITSHQSIHGYLTSIMNDYFVFNTPLYHTVYVSIEHVKSLKPYPTQDTPYQLSNRNFPNSPPSPTLSRTFEQQIKKLEGKLIIFDLGCCPNKIGQLSKLENGFLELITATGEKVYWNIQHIKTAHFPIQ